MDKVAAKNYADWKKELMELERRINRLESQIRQIEKDGVVSDSVTGTRRDGTIGSIRISGVQTVKHAERLRELKKRKLRAQYLKDKIEIETSAFEDYVYSIENGRIRRIISLRYIDGLTWQQVAKTMGGAYTADSCRITVDRFFKEK